MKIIISLVSLMLLASQIFGQQSSNPPTEDYGVKLWSAEQIQEIARQSDTTTFVVMIYLSCLQCMGYATSAEQFAAEGKARALYVVPWLLNKEQVKRYEALFKRLKIPYDKVYYLDQIDDWKNPPLHYEGKTYKGVPRTFVYKQKQLVAELGMPKKEVERGVKACADELRPYL